MQELTTIFAANGKAQNILNRIHMFVNKQCNWNDDNHIIVIIIYFVHDYLLVK